MVSFGEKINMPNEGLTNVILGLIKYGLIDKICRRKLFCQNKPSDRKFPCLGVEISKNAALTKATTIDSRFENVLLLGINDQNIGINSRKIVAVMCADARFGLFIKNTI